MRFPGRGLDATLMALVEEAGRNIQRCGLLLRDLLIDYPEHATLAQDLKVCEQEGDRITHDIIYRMGGGRRVRGGRAPFDAGDGYALATAIDDVVDYTEQAAAQMPDRLAVVRVEPGETLQHLAARVAPDAPTGQVAARIRELNELDSATVTAGQTLIAPVG